MTRIRLIALGCLVSLSLAAPLAHAQNIDGLVNRVDSLERDLQMMQRQFYRDNKEVDAPSYNATAGQGSADMLVRMGQLEEMLRDMQGQIEEVQFQQRRLSEEMQKFSEDTDWRLQQLEANAMAAPATAGENAASVASPSANIAAATPSANASSQTPNTYQPKTSASTTTPANAPSSFDSSRDHYNHAFKLLNERNYIEAADSFKAFIDAYPDDALIGNAYYWLGETYYVRGDFIRAADQFRKGFEVKPDGPKTPDNLLKLAMSLSQIQRDKEACVVLNQLSKKYATKSRAVADKAQKERARIGCQ